MKKIALMAVLALSLQCALAFNKDSTYNYKDKGFFISLVPQYIIINALCVDIEKRIKNSSHAISLSPKFYISEFDGSEAFFSAPVDMSLRGYGFELKHKIYLKNWLEGDVNWYGAYSVFHQGLFFDYQDEGWVSFVENGTTFFRIEQVDQTLSINQYGGFVTLGLVYKLDDRVYFDNYYGIGFKSSTAKDTSIGEKYKNQFSDGSLSYGYSGALWNAGIKIGILF